MYGRVRNAVIYFACLQYGYTLVDSPWRYGTPRATRFPIFLVHSDPRLARIRSCQRSSLTSRSGQDESGSPLFQCKQYRHQGDIDRCRLDHWGSGWSCHGEWILRMKGVWKRPIIRQDIYWASTDAISHPLTQMRRAASDSLPLMIEPELSLTLLLCYRH